MKTFETTRKFATCRDQCKTTATSKEIGKCTKFVNSSLQNLFVQKLHNVLGKNGLPVRVLLQDFVKHVTNTQT